MTTAKRIECAVAILTHGRTTHSVLRGFGIVDSGFLAGDFDSTGDLSRTQIVLASAFSWTGCPIVARRADSAPNPWLETMGAYRSVRRLTMDRSVAFGTLISEARGDDIRMKLQIDVEGDLPELIEISSAFQESISEQKIGVLKGKFEVPFRTADGSRIIGHSESDYELDIAHRVQAVWRNIFVMTTDGSCGYKQFEQIDLFSNKNAADSDLKTKLAVTSGT